MVGSNYEKVLRDTVNVLVGDVLSSVGPRVTSKFKDLLKFLIMPLALILKYSGILALNKNQSSHYNEFSFVGSSEPVNSKDIQTLHTPESLLLNWKAYCSGSQTRTLKSGGQLHPSLRFSEPKLILTNQNEPPNQLKSEARNNFGASYPRQRVYDNEDDEDYEEEEEDDDLSDEYRDRHAGAREAEY